MKNVTFNGTSESVPTELQVYWKEDDEVVELGSLKLPVLRNATSVVVIPLKTDLFAGNVSPREAGAYVASITVGFKLLIVPTK